jgi:DNA polymerase III subunit epsilon
MRQIFLDTETTGLNPRSGDRIIEIGCVELVNRVLTGNNYHVYINPERDSEEGALAVHGLTTEFLSTKPKFAQIVSELRDYVQGAQIIIHNAPFDLGFLNAEYARLDLPTFESEVDSVLDTLVQAKEMHPGKRNSLDALCDRYGISNSHRKLHGALLDAELLADVYLAMTRGQNSFGMELDVVSNDSVIESEQALLPLPELVLVLADDSESAANDKVLDGIDKEIRGTCLWRVVHETSP